MGRESIASFSRLSSPRTFSIRLTKLSQVQTSPGEADWQSHLIIPFLMGRPEKGWKARRREVGTPTRSNLPFLPFSLLSHSQHPDPPKMKLPQTLSFLRSKKQTTPEEEVLEMRRSNTLDVLIVVSPLLPSLLPCTFPNPGTELVSFVCALFRYLPL